MRAAFMYGAGDVRVEEIADPKLEQPTDALVRIVRACVCGSDLHSPDLPQVYRGGFVLGHEMSGRAYPELGFGDSHHSVTHHHEVPTGQLGRRVAGLSDEVGDRT